MIIFKTLLSFVYLALVCDFALCDEVFKCLGDDGGVFFCNDKSKAISTKPLPKVIRENTKERIEAIRKSIPTTCVAHGAIDCSSGRDTDNSVVCFDGFRDSVERFQDACTRAKLSVSNVEVRNESVVLSVRNSTGSEARGIVLRAKISGQEKRTYPGPKVIKAHNVEDFVIPIDQTVSKLSYTIFCKTCDGMPTGIWER